MNPRIRPARLTPKGVWCLGRTNEILAEARAQGREIEDGEAFAQAIREFESGRPDC